MSARVNTEENRLLTQPSSSRRVAQSTQPQKRTLGGALSQNPQNPGAAVFKPPAPPKKEPHIYKYLDFLYSLSFLAMLGFYGYQYYNWYSISNQLFQSASCIKAMKVQYLQFVKLSFLYKNAPDFMITYFFDYLPYLYYYDELTALGFISFLIISFIAVTIVVYMITMKDPVIAAKALAFNKEGLSKFTRKLLDLSQFTKCAFFIVFVSPALIFHVFMFKINKTSKCLEFDLDASSGEIMIFPALSIYVLVWFWVYLIIGLVLKCKQCSNNKVSDENKEDQSKRDVMLVKMLKAYQKAGYMHPVKGLIKPVKDRFWEFKEEDPKTKKENAYVVDKRDNVTVTLDIKQVNYNLREHKVCDDKFYDDKFNKIRILFNKNSEVVLDKRKCCMSVCMIFVNTLLCFHMVISFFALLMPLALYVYLIAFGKDYFKMGALGGWLFLVLLVWLIQLLIHCCEGREKKPKQEKPKKEEKPKKDEQLKTVPAVAAQPANTNKQVPPKVQVTKPQGPAQRQQPKSPLVPPQRNQALAPLKSTQRQLGSSNVTTSQRKIPVPAQKGGGGQQASRLQVPQTNVARRNSGQVVRSTPLGSRPRKRARSIGGLRGSRMQPAPFTRSPNGGPLRVASDYKPAFPKKRPINPFAGGGFGNRRT